MSIKSMEYALIINNKPIEEDRLKYISEIVFEDFTSGSDLLTITINDPDMTFIEDNIYINDAPVTFTGGYKNGDKFTFKGYISVIDIDFPEDGIPTIILNCMDNTHKMNKKKNNKTWENTKVSTVVKEIFKKYSFTFTVDDTKKVEESISQNDTDINFLLNLADGLKDPFIVYVEGNHGYFVKKPSIATPSHTLSYRCNDGNLLNFQPRINKQTKREEITVSNINLNDKNTDKSTSNNSTNRPTSGTPQNPSNSNNNSSNGDWKYENGKWVQKK